jgi:hypothetical protein
MNIQARAGAHSPAHLGSGKQNCCLSPLGCAHRSLATFSQTRQPQLLDEAVQNGAISSQKAIGLNAIVLEDIQKKEEIRRALMERDVFETTGSKVKEARQDASWAEPVHHAAQAQQLITLRLRDPMAV